MAMPNNQNNEDKTSLENNIFGILSRLKERYIDL